MSQCLQWLKNVFLDYDKVQVGESEGSPIFTHPLIFTIMGISLVCLIIEELIGVLTMFRFGGFFFRRFSSHYGSGYRTKYETEYPKSYEVDYSSETPKSFNSRFRTKYFISYNGKYYPFRHSRYNPFYARQFNSAYKAGRVVSSSQIYGQKLGNAHNSSFGSSYSAYSSNLNTKGLKGAFKWGSDMAQNAKDIIPEAWQKHKDKNTPVGEDLKMQNARAQVEEYTYNQNADWESLQLNESSSASWDGPTPPNLDIFADDDD